MSTPTVLVDVRQAQQMMDLFPCATDHHTTWSGHPDRVVPWNGEMKFDSKKGKKVPYYKTIHTSVSLEMWVQHLNGRYPLVLCPVCDDGTAKYAVLDVDDKGVTKYDMQRRVEALNLPLYVRESKSGTVHVTAFFAERVKVEAAREFARGLARLLELPDDDKIVELFPKNQDLNMPYLGKDYGFFRRESKCDELPLEKFLQQVELFTTEQRERMAATPKKQEKKGRKKRDPGDGPRYAAARLDRYSDEISKLTAEGNKTLNKRAFHMGRMVASGWIERDEVYRRFSEVIAQWDDLSRHLDTLDRGLTDGAKEEHLPLEDSVTHDSVALEFAEEHENDLRYDHEVGCWYRWTGTHWQQDRTEIAFAWVRDFARDVQRFTVNFCNNVEKFAKTDQRFAVLQDHWDRSEMLLGTPGGTVDLVTGELREARPEDMITKLTAVAPAATAACPTWLTFLNWATDNNEALRDYIQRVAGYCLTGVTKEHAMFFNYGTGRNGKGTTVNAVAGILKDYHRTAPIETFTVSSYDRHPTELAGLRGARLITATETEESRRWAQSRITQITGGDAVSARFMRQDFFEYTPTYKIWISGNHKPGLRTVNEAIQRRMNLLPWTVTIPESEKDGDLGKKLEAEWPGILRWMIDGCLEWQRRGLAAPDVVRRATAEYMESEDIIQAWINDRCERGKNYWETVDSLYSSYHNWAVASEEYDGGKRWFAKGLEDRGFGRKKLGADGVRGHSGLRLRVRKESEHQLEI